MTRRPASIAAHGVRRGVPGGHLEHALDLADHLAHGWAVGAGLLDAAQRQVDILLHPGEARRRRAEHRVQQLVHAVQVLAPVQRRLHLAHDVPAALQRLPRRDHLQHQHAEAVHVALVRQLLRHVVLRVQVTLHIYIYYEVTIKRLVIGACMEVKVCANSSSRMKN
jgi:hypothetical protein